MGQDVYRDAVDFSGGEKQKIPRKSRKKFGFSSLIVFLLQISAIKFCL